MSDPTERLRLKGKAEEDIWLARRERELAEARRAARRVGAQGPIRVVSGGQTGVDRAALDSAMGLGIPVGGWCPAGRAAEDGPIAPCYPLDETPGADAAQRTEWNVRDSDATLVVHRGEIQGGTRLTVGLARRLGRPLLVRDLTEAQDPGQMAHWLVANRVRTLNCAGPRESECPGIGVQAHAFLRAVFAFWIAAETDAERPAP